MLHEFMLQHRKSTSPWAVSLPKLLYEFRSQLEDGKTRRFSNPSRVPISCENPCSFLGVQMEVVRLCVFEKKHVLFSPDVYNNVDIILFYDDCIYIYML